MIGMAKTVDEDERNDWGFPPVEVTAQERACQTTHVDQSVNKALPWVAFSWFLSGGAFLGLILMALMVPQLIDSKVAAGVADAKSSMAQQAADAKAVANAGREHARVALDKVEQTQTQLGAKGLINVETH